MQTFSPKQKLNLLDQSDANFKLRVSEPQALIDTDFEYGLQGTKWEILETVNSYTGAGFRPSEPSYAGIALQPNGIESITGSPDQIFLGGRKPDGTMRVRVRSVPAIPFQKLNPITVKFTGTSPIWTDTTDGSGVITDVIDLSTFEYKATSPNYQNFLTNVASEATVIYTGTWLTGSLIPVSNLTLMADSCSAKLTLGYGFHNFLPGMQFLLVHPLSSGVQAHPWCGAFSVDALSASNLSNEYNTLFFYTASTFPSVNRTIVSSTSEGLSCVVNPSGYVAHRYLDGGVQLIPSAPYPTFFNALCAQTASDGDIPRQTSIVRQTRKYFRYQSGKSIMFSTGITFRPTYDVSSVATSNIFIDGITRSVLTLTFDFEVCVSSRFERDTRFITNRYVTKPFANPTRVRISGLNTSSFNGIYEVAYSSNNNSFSVIVPFFAIQLGGQVKVEILEWNDAFVRTGIFDDMNGMFWEFDGKYVNVVRRTSTNRISGKNSISRNSPTISSGTTNARIDNVGPCKTIVIRGVPYTVNNNDNLSIASGTTQRYLSPYYKGPTTGSNVTAGIVDEVRVPQFNFNLDKLDGTGPSGYILDTSKMQMVFIDYTWYGAGKIRFGIRASNGNLIWCHEMPNNNLNTEAYMRSGNLPARFEANTYSRVITGTVGGFFEGVNQVPSSPSTLTFPISVSNFDSTYLPVSGKLYFNREIFGYVKTGSQSTEFTQLSVIRRWLPGGAVEGVVGNYGTGANRTMLSFNQSCAPGVSHWGTSIIMDGGFSEDKSYLFTAAALSAVVIPPGAEYPIVSIRLAPSVDYSVPGAYGIRSIINRSQLTPDSLGLAVAGGVGQITLRLNSPYNTFTSRVSGWQNIGGGSLAQIFDHSVQEAGARQNIIGGEIVGAFFSDNTSPSTYDVTTLGIDTTRELGNSIAGGDFPHPDGPDVLTLSLRNISTQNNPITGFGRLTWTESQG